MEWWLFIPAAILLLFPGDKLMSSQVGLLNFDRSSNRSVGPRRQRSVYVRWIEPLRGFGGTYCLKLALPLTTELWAYVPGLEYGVFVGLLAVGVILQTLTRREEDAMLAPVGYLVGMLFALVSWPVALIAVVFGVTSLFAFRQLQAFFGLTAVVVTLIGLLLKVSIIWVLPAVLLLLIPGVMGLTTGRSMEMPVPPDQKEK